MQTKKQAINDLNNKIDKLITAGKTSSKQYIDLSRLHKILTTEYHILPQFTSKSI